MASPQPEPRVQTPIGPGTIECQWHLFERPRILVRVQITDANRQHLADENCMTRHNEIFGLWIYDAAECQA